MTVLLFRRLLPGDGSTFICIHCLKLQARAREEESDEDSEGELSD